LTLDIFLFLLQKKKWDLKLACLHETWKIVCNQLLSWLLPDLSPIVSLTFLFQLYFNCYTSILTSFNLLISLGASMAEWLRSLISQHLPYIVVGSNPDRDFGLFHVYVSGSTSPWSIEIYINSNKHSDYMILHKCYKTYGWK
jgi:hypothetical protein